MDGRYNISRISLQKKILISENQKQQLINHAKKSTPNESCAILFGTTLDNTYHVSEVYLTENIEKSNVNFTISNEELIDAYKTAEEKKLDIVGIFHSHPDSHAIPSETDKKFMQINPVIWVIYSGMTGILKAFYLDKTLQSVTISQAEN